MLGDHELKRRLRDSTDASTSIVSGFPAPWDNSFDGEAWDGKSSPIQAASRDLHVGVVFVPGKKVGQLGGQGNGHLSFNLQTGHSVVVSTHETLNLPPDLAGIAFPPSKLSSKGILVANIGHIDPGYVGPLRFTLINMGAEEFPLRQGEELATLMLFEVRNGAKHTWLQRNSAPGAQPTKDEIDRLSFDFVNFDKRARKISADALGASGWKMAAVLLGLPLLASVITWAATMHLEVVGVAQSVLTQNADLRVEVATRNAEMAARIERLENVASRRRATGAGAGGQVNTPSASPRGPS